MPKIVPGYSDAARARISDAAVKVFSKKGYRDATMDDIARELGVTKGALYHHYRLKVDILKEIYRKGHQSVREFLHGSLKESDPVVGLEGLFDLATGDYKEFLPIELEILSLASKDPEVRKVITEDRREDLAVIERYLRGLSRKGAIRRDVDVELMAASLQALFLGMHITNLLGFGIFEDESERRRSVALLLGGS